MLPVAGGLEEIKGSFCSNRFKNQPSNSGSQEELALLLPNQMASDSAVLGNCPMFPQTNLLPYPKDAGASLHSQRNCLGTRAHR